MPAAFPARPSPLEPLYSATALLSAIAMVAIAGVILADVVLRQFGGQVQSGDDFAGYALAATALLGLGPTYRRNEHIRVGLLIDRLRGTPRRLSEGIVLAVGLLGVGWATIWAGRFAFDSFRYNELSQGLLAIPLWIPHLSMVLGFAVLAIALAEDLLLLLTGRTPTSLAASQGDDLPTFER